MCKTKFTEQCEHDKDVNESHKILIEAYKVVSTDTLNVLEKVNTLGEFLKTTP